MKRSAYLAAATIAALAACKQTIVVDNNAATTAAGTTANLAVNEIGTNNEAASTGVIDTNVVNGTTNEQGPADNTANSY